MKECYGASANGPLLWEQGDTLVGYIVKLEFEQSLRHALQRNFQRPSTHGARFTCVYGSLFYHVENSGA